MTSERKYYTHGADITPDSVSPQRLKIRSRACCKLQITTT
jgi:hypothetical protein